MQKTIREVDQERGIVQITVADERWYMKPSTSETSGIPTYKGVPSVTWKASYYPKGVGYYKWLGEHGWDESQALMREAGDKGSRVHLAVEKIIAGEEFRIDTKVADKSIGMELELSYDELVCVKSFCDWRAEMEQEYLIETVRSETVVFSEKHDYAGTIDWIVRLTPKAEGKNPLKLAGPTIFVVDFKTSQQVWTSAEMQVSAYKKALESGENPIKLLNDNGTETGEMMDVTNIRVAILQLGYKLNKKYFKFTEVDDCFDMFLVSSKIWEREVGKQEVKVVDFPIVLSAGKPKPEAAVEPEVPEQSTLPELEIPSAAVELPKPKKAAGVSA